MNDWKLDVNVCRGEAGGMSDHFLVEARLKVVGGWKSVGRMEDALMLTFNMC